MANAIVFGDIVEANGKTIRDNNRDIPHNIPLGAVVEVDFDKSQVETGVRPNN